MRAALRPALSPVLVPTLSSRREGMTRLELGCATPKNVRDRNVFIYKKKKKKKKILVATRA